MLDADGPILCAVDDADASRAAAMTAADLSIRLGTELVLLHVVDVLRAPRMRMAPHAHAESGRDAHAEAEELLERVAAEEQLPRAERRVVSGRPADAIVEQARDVGAALVVVGSHSDGRLARAALGSVSMDVAAKAACPVLIVPG